MEFEKADIEELIKCEMAEAILRFGEGVKAPIMRIVCLERMLTPEKTEQKQHSRMIPVSQWNEFYPEPSVSALRGLIQRNVNGFRDSVVEKRGKRLLINEDNYFEWQKNCSYVS